MCNRKRFFRIGFFLTVAFCAYLAPFVMFSTTNAAATSCAVLSNSTYPCLSEGAPWDTRAYAGIWQSNESKRGVQGQFAVPATTLQDASSNGFAHWVGLNDSTLPGGYTWTRNTSEWASLTEISPVILDTRQTMITTGTRRRTRGVTIITSSITEGTNHNLLIT